MKRRFEFRLERVRRVREIEEHVARAERVRAEDVARGAESARDLAREALEESRAAVRTMLAGTLDPRRVLATHGLLDDQLARLRLRVETARTLRAQAERIAAVHRERRSAVRGLEELRERARLQHEAELQKLDNLTLDEGAQRRDEAGRRKRRAGSDSRTGAPPSDLSDEPHPQRP